MRLCRSGKSHVFRVSEECANVVKTLGKEMEEVAL